MSKRHVTVIGLVSLSILLLISGCGSAATAPVNADRTQVLQKKFDALTPGSTLRLDGGTYRHSGALKIRVPNVTITGDNTVLAATNDLSSSVQVSANGVSISGITFNGATRGQRQTGLDQHKLVISGQNDTVRDVTINGSAAAGLFVDGAKNFTIDRVNVSNTLADGVHITNGASGGSVSNVTTSGTGDDGVAVVSYANGGLCSDIKETNITVNGNRWGRGISVVGGIRISINGLNVSNTAAAGLYIASEGNPFYTHSVWQVSVASGTITSANVGTAVQGAILVYAGNRGHGIDSVRIADVTIKSTPAKAGRDVAVLADGGAPISNISFTQIALVDSSVQPFVTNVPRQISTTSRWSRNQIPLEVK
ncbi:MULTISPECIES: right-handed parallel beta-helix repeat-containing protein [Gordonia]|uniref:Right handed beta helix domain-containing protein n=1 Tax=Gordonia sputi NBRC 100414 TaxID=1089453 RepID=H5U6D1_9ACTN|nr:MULTISPECIES: right-handed parallel beta-helix repeat-containing protein [Gordonia]NKY92183.1 glycoside hydrolase [Gordonia sputi]OBA73832.1 hypothetical protein A5777_00925 [Gordonia sp. 852002-10350_SCH5691597]GAB41289.1 hypothetical protein GOSPT_125_00560 [Gordonia sputi NBRC 100414]